MGHRRAALTPLGRRIVVERVLVEGWTQAATAAATGVSRPTVAKWVKRFREEGPPGLEDRSSAPHRRPHALSPRQVHRILRARRRTGDGPHRLGPMLGHPRSTVYGVLRRYGCSRVSDTDRSTRIPIRYERHRPGEIVHVDVKRLPRVPRGGGHRLLGRSTETRTKPKTGYDYVHVAVDDHSRVAFVQIHPDELGTTTARFLLDAAAHYAELGVKVERVMTDRHLSYTRSTDFKEAVAAIGARHLTTHKYRPQTNGKAERFIQSMLREWAYRRLYSTNGARLRALPLWVGFYNQRRPHTALGGRPPLSRLTT